MSYELISHYEVSASSEASVVIDNIPNTYEDLRVVISSRTTRSDAHVDYIYMQLNDSTTNYYSRFLYKDGSTVSASTRSTREIAYVNSDTTAANNFATTEVYIGKYAEAVNKQVTTISTGTNYGSASQVTSWYSTTWSDTSAVTKLTFTALNGDFKQYSTFDVYGVKKLNTTGSPKATGGIISFDSVNNKWVHIFTASGTFTPTENLTAEYLVVAGGGGGSQGAGGGGGYRSSVSGESSGGGASAETPLSLTASTGYTVTVGAGGATGSGNGTVAGTNGADSTFATVTSTGGGGGGAGGVSIDGVTGKGRNGGSGGGGGQVGAGTAPGGTGTTNQGYAGGSNGGFNTPYYPGGAGGGAGAVGQNGISGNQAGNGGDGVQSSITGAATYYAGGGGGGLNTSIGGIKGSGGRGGGGDGKQATSGLPGQISTGGGAGGGNYATIANGGSGIVIVRYAA